MRAYQAVIMILAFMLTSCAGESLPPSQGHIPMPSTVNQVNQEDIPSLVNAIPMLPLPKLAEREERFTVVVQDVPVRDLLFSLARDARLNIDIHPGITGSVTMNAVEQPLLPILERIAAQVGLRYEIKDNTIAIKPDLPYWKGYKIDYLGMERKTSTELNTSIQIGSTGSSGGSGSDVSSSKVNTKADDPANEFWKPLILGIENIIQSDEAQTAQNAATALLASAMSISGTGGAQTPTAAPAPGTESSSKKVMLHTNSGVVNVYATANQHDQIQAYVDQVISSVQRQVLIEATVVEVVLSDQYQAGVDWRIVFSSAGNARYSIAQATGGTASVFTVDKTLSDITGAVKAMQQFGNTRVLSSPKVMAINNQLAVLKVVDHKVFFSITATPATAATRDANGNLTAGTPSTINATAKTVPDGLIMLVTPQISTDNMITLNVRPSLSTIPPRGTNMDATPGWVRDPTTIVIQDPNNPLQLVSQQVNSYIPEINVREMESILRVFDGQIVILGGLMKDSSIDSRSGVPGLSSIPVLGDLFSYRSRTLQKSEIAIFLKTTIITPDTMAQHVARQSNIFATGKEFNSSHDLQELVKDAQSHLQEAFQAAPTSGVHTEPLAER